MKAYIIAAHTADIRLITEGTTLPELFNAALEGMSAIISTESEKNIAPASTIEISTKSDDLTTLLIDFLSDILTKTHLNKALYHHADFILLNDTILKARLQATPLKKFDRDIKAVTYHEAHIVKNTRGNYQTMIVFDI